MSTKMSIRERWRQTWTRRRVEKEKRLLRKYAGVRVSRPPRPMKTPIMVAMMALVGLTYYLVTMLLVKRVIEGFLEYVLILMGVVFAATTIILREGTISSASRTLKIKVGDMPAVVADGHIPGGNVKYIRFVGVDDQGEEIDETRPFEIGWGGPLKRWPFKGRGPAFIMLCQYDIDGKKGKTPQAGFMMGDTYVVPLVPDAYRMDAMEASRDSRYGKMLRATEEISNRIHDRTWVVLATKPISLPEGKVHKGSTIDDMELFHEKRLRARITDTLHGVGVDDIVTESMGIKKG